jgi:hypothetical protein
LEQHLIYVWAIGEYACVWFIRDENDPSQWYVPPQFSQHRTEKDRITQLVPVDYRDVAHIFKSSTTSRHCAAEPA